MKIRPILLIITFVILTILLGCEKQACVTSFITKDLAFSIRTLQDQTDELQEQTKWLALRLNRCLTELEKQSGIEPINLTDAEIMGFYQFKSDPNLSAQYPNKPEPLYVPYKSPPMSDTNSEDWTHTARLQCFVDICNGSLQLDTDGNRKYIEYFEKRLQQLEKMENKQ